MSNITEKRTQELLTELMSTLGSLDKAHDLDEEPLGHYSSDNFTPDGFYDEDLLDIQAMSDEAVSAELQELGYSESTIAKNAAVCSSDKVVQFPNPKNRQRKIEAKLQSTVMAVLIQEALLKRASLTEKHIGTEFSQKVVDSYQTGQRGTHPNVIPIVPKDDNSSQSTSGTTTEKRLIFYKRAFGIAASLLFLVSMIGVVPTLRDTQSDKPVIAVAENKIINPDTKQQTGLQRTYYNPEENSPVATSAILREVAEEAAPNITLQYEPTMDFLNKINSGEIEASTVEKLRIARKLREVASADVLLVKKEGRAYQDSNTCAAFGTFDYAVLSGDTLSGIINRCAYSIGDPSFFKMNQVLNIGDILVMEVDKSRALTRVVLERENKSPLTLYQYENR